MRFYRTFEFYWPNKTATKGWVVDSSLPFQSVASCLHENVVSAGDNLLWIQISLSAYMPTLNLLHPPADMALLKIQAYIKPT